MNNRARIGLAVICIAGGVWAAVTVWRASRALGEAERQTTAKAQFSFTNRELHASPTGIEQIGAPSHFHDAVSYKGNLYAAGAGGLFTDGQQFRVGDLLPPAPVTTMAVGITSHASGPELWLGTAGEGMLTFNGSRFRHLRPSDGKARNITSVLALGAGRVLFGTQKAGVLAYDGETLSYLHDNLRDQHVTALSGDDTDLWVGTIRGLLHWRAGQVSEIAGLPDKHVLSLARSSDGFLYAGTALGIAVVRNGAVERVIGDGLFAKSLYSREGRLFAGTLDPGIHDIPIAGGRPRFIETAHPVHKIFEIDERLLAASSEGIFEAGSGGEVLQPNGAVLTDRNISALSVDGLGRIWVGYFDRGLDILEADLSRAKHLEDQHLFCINRIVHSSTTAVATANGLVLFDATAQKRQVLGRDQGLIANHVTDVTFRGSEMIAATPAGISFIAPDGIRSLYAFHGLVNNHAYALGEVGHRLLAGTLGGLSVLESGTVRVSYTTSNSPLRHNWVTAIAASGSDAFVGTYGAGVIRLGSDGSWQTFADLPSSTEINPGAMAATSTKVYAGTLGKGLLLYDRSDNRWHTVTQGLPSLNVTAVHIAKDRVYVGTDNGLVRLP